MESNSIIRKIYQVRMSLAKEESDITMTLENLFKIVDNISSSYLKNIISYKVVLREYNKIKDEGILSQFELAIVEEDLAQKILELAYKIENEQKYLNQLEEVPLEEYVNEFTKLIIDGEIEGAIDCFKSKVLTSIHTPYYDEFFIVLGKYYSHFNDDKVRTTNILRNELILLIQKIRKHDKVLKSDSISVFKSTQFVKKTIEIIHKFGIHEGIDYIAKLFNIVFLTYCNNLRLINKDTDVIKIKSNESALAAISELNFDQNYLSVKQTLYHLTLLEIKAEKVKTDFRNGFIGFTQYLQTINDTICNLFDFLENHFWSYHDNLNDFIKIEKENSEKKTILVKELQQVKKLIAKAKILDALEKLGNLLEQEEVKYYDEVILQKSRLKQNERDKRLGLEFDPNVETKIGIALLHLINEIN